MIKDVQKDSEKRTMAVTAEFDAPIERVWELYANPRKLERWWGPPTYPATVVDHDLVPGGRVTYFMTGPDGDKHSGWWNVLSVDAPNSFEIDDGFADASGQPNPDMPVTRMRVAMSEDGGTTRVVITSTFSSTDAMEQLLNMGMDEGMREAMGQMDEVLESTD